MTRLAAICSTVVSPSSNISMTDDGRLQLHIKLQRMTWVAFSGGAGYAALRCCSRSGVQGQT
jgi:hypothetical protein